MGRAWWFGKESLLFALVVAAACGSEEPSNQLGEAGSAIIDASLGTAGVSGNGAIAAGGQGGSSLDAATMEIATDRDHGDETAEGSPADGSFEHDAAAVDAEVGSDACRSGDAPPDGLASTDPCLGPTPACSSNCPDSDGDGLNDAWELVGGIDRNGDGKIDACHDLVLPGANVNKPDVYVQYDWMDYATAGNPCAIDSDCSALGSGHVGEKCSGPQVLPDSPKSCAYPCAIDSDCTSKGLPGAHVGDKCMAGACYHTHDPEVQAPRALDAVVESYATHGINLHIVRGFALPHSMVVSFRPNTAPPGHPFTEITSTCEGAGGAWVGAGKYAESLYDLKKRHFPDDLQIAYHYAIFGHYNSCDSAAHCPSCAGSTNPDGSPKSSPSPGSSGIAEISGNDFIVSLGNRVEDVGIAPGLFSVASTFMHELGHNLGLRHGGGIDTPCKTDDDCPLVKHCSDTPVGKYCLNVFEINWKPNYLSVMNYRYQFTGISSASRAGQIDSVSCQTDADCPAQNHCNAKTCARLDYSNLVLPVAGNTPGKLDPSTVTDLNGPHLGLSEPAGLGSGTADTFTFTDSKCDIPATRAASDGPVDWNGDGDVTDTNVGADVISGVDRGCVPLSTGPFLSLSGEKDWLSSGPIDFTFKFQCTPFGGPLGDGAALPSGLAREVSTQEVLDAHAMYPIRGAKIVIRPECSNKNIAAGRPGAVSVALLGDTDFDVRDVAMTSLKFHHAPPITSRIADVDHDGKPDLVVTFDTSLIKLHRRATRANLRGWLKSSQLFVGEDTVSVVEESDRQRCR